MRLRNAALALAAGVLLVPAVVLTTLRLTDPSGAKAIQAVAFTPFAIPLYAAALLLMVAVMVVRRTTGVPLIATTVLAGAGLVLHGWWFAPQVSGDAPEAAPGAEPVVVMTSNLLRGRADVAQLMDLVRDHDVDLLVVTEITQTSLAGMEVEGLTDLLPFRAGNPSDVETVTGTMVFSDEPAEIVDVLDTELDGLVVDAAGLRLLAVHPMAPVWADRWRDEHAVVLEAVEAQSPDVVAGDFNATLDQAPMRALADAGYRDAIELTNGGFQPTWPQDGGFGMAGLLGPSVQIDHVMVSDDWTVTEAETTELDDSDHKPVVAVVARR